MTFFQRFYVLLALLAGAGLLSLGVWLLPQGPWRLLAFGVAAVVFAGICWLGNRRQSLNDRAGR